MLFLKLDTYSNHYSTRLILNSIFPTFLFHSVSDNLDFEDIIQQILMERLLSKVVKKDISELNSDSTSTSIEADSPMLISETLNTLTPTHSVSSLPSEPINDKSNVNKNISMAILESRTAAELFFKKQLHYLMDCYDRVGTEERSYPKVKFCV